MYLGRTHLFAGNCQISSVYHNLIKQPPDDLIRPNLWLASPLTYLSSPGVIPAVLQELLADPGTRDHMDSRFLENQFILHPLNEPDPETVCLSLFHEPTPLFQHKQDKFVFYVAKSIEASYPKIGQWLAQDCVAFEPDPSTYLIRYFEMVERLIKRWPHTRFLLLKRASPRLGYGGKTSSYLKKWNEIAAQLPGRLQSFPTLSVLDIDRVVGGLLHDHNLALCHIFPFLGKQRKFPLQRLRRFAPGLINRLAYVRDIEHPHPLVWQRVAELVGEWQRTNQINYRRQEVMPNTFSLLRRHWRARHLDTDNLENAAPYQWAHVCEQMLWDPRPEQWKQLELHATHFPCDKLLLRNLRLLVELHPTSEAINFLRRHAQAIQQSNPQDAASTKYLRLVQESLIAAEKA